MKTGPISLGGGKIYSLECISLFSMGLDKRASSLFFVCFFLEFLFDFDKKDMLREPLVPAEPKAFAGVGTGSQVSF